MNLNNRVRIIVGSDVSTIVRLKNVNTGDPIDLTSVTKIQAVFKKNDNTDFTIDNTQIPAVKAQVTYANVTFIADTAGADGNDIILQFDGVSTIDTIVNAWNTANPSKTVSYSGGTGTDVLAVSTVRPTNGYNAYYPIQVYTDAILGKIKIVILEKDSSQLKIGKGQSFTVILDFGTFPGGTRVKGFFNNLDIIDSE